MSIGTILYSIFIGPLQLLFEVIFSLANRITNHPGLTIISLSLSMNFLILPLYMRADALQEEERDIEMKLAAGVAHIKKTFKGDERMMMLQTYYRQNNYKPTYVLRGAMSLFLEIPFFIAAYRFLSTLPILSGVSFGPITDLGQPDGLLAIGGIAVNILPIIMTSVNAVSTAIFTKGYPTKTKVQLYAMALFFLVFLYDSPAGLVFYWTLNNVFSLVKTIFYKLPNPKKVLCYLASVTGVASIALGIRYISVSHARMTVFGVLGLLLQIPIAVYMMRKHNIILRKSNWLVSSGKKGFVCAAVLLTVLMGLLIPANVISTSPLEFVNMSAYMNPVWYIVSALCMAVGTFLVWLNVFYSLSNDKGKVIIEMVLKVFAVVAIVNYMFFGKRLGTLLPSLQYEEPMAFARSEILVNLLVVMLVIAVVIVICRYKGRIINDIMVIGAIALIIMAGRNMLSIRSDVSKAVDTTSHNVTRPEFTLSKEGHNVVVIMLDRAMGEFVPYIMSEKPELKEDFSGFTYYSHAMSYGGHTNFASPALFGGYEYTPEKINMRSEESLVDKQNEALKVMPVLFERNGYNVTVCDPTYAGYQWIPDLTIYDEYPDINAFNTDGYFLEEDVNNAQVRAKERDFFCYSLVKSLPVIMQNGLYDDGNYHNLSSVSYTAQAIESDMNKAQGLNENFISAYAVLENMINMTVVDEGSSDNFLMLSNDTTHEPMLTQKDEYVPQAYVDNTFDPDTDRVADDEYNTGGRILHVTDYDNQLTQYHSTMAAFEKLGEWFNYLRENDLYDNTRIILVSDHGHGTQQIYELIRYFSMEEGNDLEYYFPLLMVKDFGSKQFAVSDEYMTNADTPYIATKDVIDNPVNPFTGNVISDDAKDNPVQYVFESDLWETGDNDGNVFNPGRWYMVYTEDIWNQYCWNIAAEDATLPVQN